MTLVEWGTLPAATLAPLYQREETRWRDALDWDTSATWLTIETARQTWGLPGVACLDASGGVTGWTFYLRRDRALSVGGLVSDTPAETAALLDALLESREPVEGFFRTDDAPGLFEALEARHLGYERYAYLARASRALTPASPAPRTRAWTAGDAAGVAALLRQAYGADGRLFARDNTPGEWRTYVDQLVSYSGCGTLRQDLSRVIDAGGRVDGVALVTALSSRTAHLAQIAVNPRVRRSGVGRALLGEVCAGAAAAGFDQVSLLVADRNLAARRLYASWDFVERGRFVALGGATADEP